MPIIISGGFLLLPRPPADTGVLVAASVVLQQLRDGVPTDHFTLGWLMHNLHKRSFGIIMLLIALVATAPGLSPGIVDDGIETTELVDLLGDGFRLRDARQVADDDVLGAGDGSVLGRKPGGRTWGRGSGELLLWRLRRKSASGSRARDDIFYV
jgi:hypothetical protein